MTGDFPEVTFSSNSGAVLVMWLEDGTDSAAGGCFPTIGSRAWSNTRLPSLRQRIGALAFAPDQRPRPAETDPLHALIAGKADVLDRLCEGDKGKALAAHSTLNPLELGALGRELVTRRSSADPKRSRPC